MTKNNIPDEMRDLAPDHISVCICTYKRPKMLARALDGAVTQLTDSAFTLEVVIVDNDEMRSAQELADMFQRREKWKIIYDCEPEKNIALARNRTIRNASGNLIAFIDDDEFPAENWLQKMHQCIKDYRADGVLGPVLPSFPPGAPKWLAKSGLCERPRNVTGSPARIEDLRTGNALVKRDVFEKDAKWFDPALGLTGGSDGVFLWEQIQRGRTFVWCDEAIVSEIVPEERWTARFYLRRNFRIGAAAGGVHRRSRNIGAVLISFLIVLGYSMVLPFSFFGGKHTWMKKLTKIYYHAGCLNSFFGLVHVPYRQ
jgi:glycosyltransferase involved in cell wall biosynthesis